MKPHDALAAYLGEVELLLGSLRAGYVESYLEELLTAYRANLRVRVRFENGRLLEINEALAVEDGLLQHLDYRYHCQDAESGFLFRYDSAPHFPDLPLHPCHKHLPDRTIGHPRPGIDEILAEALTGVRVR
jgi:hypothetical protein